MTNSLSKSKRFLFPIIALVVLSIVSISAISSYLTINVFYKHMDDHIEQTTKEYTQEQKIRVYNHVKFVDESIKFEISKIEDEVKISLKQKIQISLDIAHYTYETYKDKLSKQKIREKIAHILKSIEFESSNSYYFIYDYNTKVMLSHPMAKFEGKDMNQFEDSKGKNIIKLSTQALEQGDVGFNKIYFNKLENQNEEFPKINCVTKFEPLDIVIGIGEYLDIVEEKAKKNILERFAGIADDEKDKYIVILDVHSLDGGDDFATVLLNSNRPDLVGNKVSDKGVDIKGNRFRKDFLDLIKAKGEGYSEYWYKKPSTNSPALKISYVYFQKDWNWIILSGFYYDDLEKQILNMEKSTISQTASTLNKTLVWSFLLSFVALIVAIFVSLRIDKTIKIYTDQIIDYEDKKRKQENLLAQKSKLSSMGEMIGNIAHQWRQPLASISMDANNILVDIDLDAVEIQSMKKNAENIVKQTNYLSKTIDDFRKFIRGDREKKVFNLQHSIDSFLDLVKGEITHHNIIIVQNTQKDLEIVGYENELIQCFINIFNNAKDALEQNIPNQEKKIILLTTTLMNGKVVISIKDNAGGIAEDILPKIFEPYFTTKYKSQGTGLGLSMTYKLIFEGMKGNIIANNAKFDYEGKEYSGAEFVILLPLS